MLRVVIRAPPLYARLWETIAGPHVLAQIQHSVQCATSHSKIRSSWQTPHKFLKQNALFRNCLLLFCFLLAQGCRSALWKPAVLIMDFLGTDMWSQSFWHVSKTMHNIGTSLYFRCYQCTRGASSASKTTTNLSTSLRTSKGNAIFTHRHWIKYTVKV